MCGITGIFSFADRERTWPDTGLAGMIHAVRHRGPDGEGRHVEPGIFLGHARLAVIDLTDDACQPMVSADDRFVLCYNGEIYNFKQLRIELESCGHRFRTRSDTEVLLCAWLEWGERSLAKLDGMFAFALFDRKARSLHLVRDPVGIKPLFYMIRDGQVFFSSELLGLFGPLNPCPDQDPGDLDTYFTFNYLPAPRTGLQGVRQLEGGCLVRVDESGPKTVRYHQLEAVGLRTFSAENVVDFDGTLRASVKQQMMTDVPLGLFLSGGLDSYAVASAAVSAGQQPEAFTLGFADAAYDETAAADQYARYLGLNDHAVQFVLDETAIRSTLNAMGELLADASCFPLYQLSGFARKQVTVILAGDGADELLAGYDTYRAGEITPLLQMLPQAVRSTAAALVRHLPVDDSRYGLRMVASRLLAAADAGHARDHASFRLIFSEELKRRLYSPEMLHGTSGGDPVGEYAALVENAPDGSSYLAARQEADLVFHLPSILAKVDRMSMAHGLEVRVPFLGRDMVAFCKGLDDDAKRGWGRGKRILRKSLQGNIPAQGLRRRKTGFLPPVDSWFREKGPLHSVFAELLMTARGNLPALDWDQVESYWHEHRTGRTDGGFVLLGILQYINWSMKCRRL